MIDIHTHLIPGVDDGSKSIEDTLEIFKEAEKAGFTDIILTSHYLIDYYETKPEELIPWKDKLQEMLENEGIKIKLHSGMEVYISQELNTLMKENKILTLANSKYLLVELPMSTSVKYLDYIIYFLESIGMKLVLAHPERYKDVQKNHKLVEDYIEKGCLIQCNYGSVLGQYGNDAKKAIKYLLKKDLVHFMATDCHRKGGIYLDISKALKKIEKIVGKDKLYDITTSNARKILDDEKW